MREVTPSAAAPTRRLVTVGALGAVVVALAGCGIRLEDDAPRVPLVPTREPIAAEDALVRLLGAVQAASVASFVTTDRLAPLLPPLHARQATVLHDALRQRGVPESALPTATPSPTASAAPAGTPATATPGGTSAPSASAGAALPRRTVTEVESAVLAASTGLQDAEPELRPVLVALLGQAEAAVLLSGGAGGAATPTPSPTAPPTPSPSASASVATAWSSPSALAPLITAVRRATFLLEVAAARSPRAIRTAWLRDITALQALTADLVTAAGDAAPLPDLAQTLPRPVTTPAEAATLATEAMSTLLAATGGSLRTLTDADPEAALAAAPGWVGTVAAAAHRHGTRLTAFPGLA
ncbi:hypothetical protein GCM10022415_00520 [Knoellia locipacati]|uniref:DUF4439 domain-containing protein n=1 Tax=Knoellia locipacati TaxID=882824 RepID=A0A512SVS2_9MICO|nr:hypothetical protein [Knoellia locipacati]GEQ12005.1 hypothetical protein KLO01_00520 [Knoellia locipacati]